MKLNSEKLTKIYRKFFEQYCNLPLPVYVIDIDGNFIQSNSIADSFFSIEKNKLDSINIITYYRYKQDRDFVISKLKSTAVSKWVTIDFIELEVNDRVTIVKSISYPFFENAQLKGSLCILVETSKSDKFEPLIDKIPIGIFELDSSNIIISSNKAFNNLLNTSTHEHKNLESFFANMKSEQGVPSEFNLRNLTNFEVLIKSNEDSYFLSRLNILPQYLPDYGHSKKLGSIEDISFTHILSRAPIGLYLVATNHNGEEVFVKVNKQFAELHGYANPEDIEGKLVKTFHATQQSYDHFLEMISRTSNGPNNIKDYLLQIVDHAGVKHDVIVNATYIKSDDGSMLRTGFVYLVSPDIKNKLTDSLADFAGLLHSYETELFSIRDTIQSIIQSHGTDVVRNYEVNVNAASERVKNHFTGFRTLFATLKKENINRNLQIDDETISIIEHYSKMIQDALGDSNPDKLKLAIIRRASWEIREQLYTIPTAVLGKEILKSFTFELSQILRFTKLLSLEFIINGIKETILEIATFKSAIIDGHKPENILEPVNILQQLHEVSFALQEYATQKGLVVNIRSDHPTIHVNAASKNIYRVFYNVIHNAIKYSHKFPDYKNSVNIRIQLVKHQVVIEITNTGVPITKEEMEKNLLFEFNFRGSYSSDRKRSGTGIGLWQAKQIVQLYGGYIHIESIPQNHNFPNDFARPFTTKVTISFKYIL